MTDHQEGIHILHLPDDILVYIFKSIKYSDVFNVILTCKRFWSLMVNNNTIWRSVCRDRLIINKTSNSHFNDITWYNRCRISNNWCKGIYKKKVIVQYPINYMPWLKLYDSQYLLVSKGSHLYCYTINKTCHTKILWTLHVPMVKRNDVRTNDISKFAIKNDYLICGNRDGSTAIYRVDNIREKPKLINHNPNCHKSGEVEITAVEIISENTTCHGITASAYSTQILFWDYDCNITQSVMEIPIYSGNGVRSLAVNNGNNKLAVGLVGNSKPLLIDVITGQFLMSDETSHGHEAVKDIIWHNDNFIICVRHSGFVNVYDIRTHSMVYHAVDPLNAALYCLKSDGNNAILVGSSQYSRCVLFDIRNSRIQKQLFFTQKRASPVYCLDFDSSRLITGVDRGISTLNFNVNSANIPKKDFSQMIFLE